MAKCPMHAISSSMNGVDGDLLWSKVPSIELRNYQTNQSFKVDGPAPKSYQDCRHQVCTSTFMSLPVRGHDDRSKETKLPKYTQEEILKEAHEFLTIFHEDKKTTESEYRSRLSEVEHQIKTTGEFDPSTAELLYGCQLAWRNAGRCINRLYWQSLGVFDKRHVTTNREMFEAICDHLRVAYSNGNLKATVLVLPKTARLWSTQYLRFACYEQPDGSLLGDPANRELTQAAMKLGWNKAVQDRTQWDPLPIIVQCDPNVEPSWYELPNDLRPIVYLSHPDPKFDHAIKSLGLRWFAQPFVGDKAIEIGGKIFRCVPFSGWFMQTEIGRNLCDLQRYNMIPKLAAILDLDVTPGASSQLNIDRIYVEVNAAVLYSFQKAKVSIVDHHNAAAGFMKFMKQEIDTRGNTPADWVWLVPPISGGMSVVFHQEMLNYIVKPRVLDQTDPWHFYDRFEQNNHTTKSILPRRSPHYSWTLIRAVRRIIGLGLRSIKKGMSVTVLYASTTGTAQSYAQQMTNRLSSEGYQATLLELDQYDFKQKKTDRSLLFIITSTFGQGNAPDNGKKVESWLQNEIDDLERNYDSAVKMFNPSIDQHETYNPVKNTMKWCTYGMCAIGSSAYPSFCGFGKSMDRTFQLLGANRLVPIGTCDALHQQYKTYNQWEEIAIAALKKMYPLMKKTSRLSTNLNSKEPPVLMRSVSRIEKRLSINRSIVQSKYIELEFFDETDEIIPKERQRSFTKENPFTAIVLRNVELISDNVQSDSNEMNSSLNHTLPLNEVASPRTKNKVLDIPNIFTHNGNLEKHSVRFIEFQTDGLVHFPGDHVYIYPENTLADVNGIIKRCGWQLADPKLRKPCSLASLTHDLHKSLREILTSYVDLNTPLRPHVLNIVATYAKDEKEQRQLLELGKGGRRYDDWLVNLPTVKETLDQFKSIEIPLHELIQILPSIQPRPYSISSSNRLHENRIQITVSIVSNTTLHGVIRKGFCSNYLLQTSPMHAADGGVIRTPWPRKPSQVRLFVDHNPYFRLPGQESLSGSINSRKITDGDVYRALNSPLLIFAVGAGIAPFRSFWQELQILEKQLGHVEVDRILFMGCRTPNDFLYENELKAISESTRTNKPLFTAVIPTYSRMQPGVKRYIQDTMLEYDQRIFSIVADDSAFIYMCGSVRVCQGIECTLLSIIQTCHPTITTHLEAQELMNRMKQEGRIRQEMYG